MSFLWIPLATECARGEALVSRAADWSQAVEQNDVKRKRSEKQDRNFFCFSHLATISEDYADSSSILSISCLITSALFASSLLSPLSRFPTSSTSHSVFYRSSIPRNPSSTQPRQLVYFAPSRGLANSLEGYCSYTSSFLLFPSTFRTRASPPSSAATHSAT